MNGILWDAFEYYMAIGNFRIEAAAAPKSTDNEEEDFAQSTIPLLKDSQKCCPKLHFTTRSLNFSRCSF